VERLGEGVDEWGNGRIKRRRQQEKMEGNIYKGAVRQLDEERVGVSGRGATDVAENEPGSDLAGEIVKVDCDVDRRGISG
jgi:hypothetical protein